MALNDMWGTWRDVAISPEVLCTNTTVIYPLAQLQEFNCDQKKSFLTNFEGDRTYTNRKPFYFEKTFFYSLHSTKLWRARSLETTIHLAQSSSGSVWHRKRLDFLLQTPTISKPIGCSSTERSVSSPRMEVGSSRTQDKEECISFHVIPDTLCSLLRTQFGRKEKALSHARNLLLCGISCQFDALSDFFVKWPWAEIDDSGKNI